MEKSINAIRMLGTAAINQANSGHPGIVLGAAPMVYTLFTNHLNVNPKKDKWINRDRFILSAGHGSALLYSILHLSGFNIPMSEIKKFRQLNSLTPGHPESHLTPGVDVTTGPLGQGFAMAVGQAVAETFLSTKYNRENYPIFDHFTYSLCGDGDLQEGVTQEAISLAGHWKLNKLIVLFDSNNVQLDNMVDIAQSEKIKERFIAANWNYLYVADGNNIDEINKAIIEAKKSTEKPTFIEIKTIIGYGATKAGTPAVHGAPLGSDLATVKKFYNWTANDFEISDDIYQDFSEKVSKRGEATYQKWEKMLDSYLVKFPKEAKEINKILNDDYHVKIENLIKLNPQAPQSTRNSSGLIIDKISSLLPTWIGGSADLTGSTKAKGADGFYSYNNRLGRNIAYGVREFAMGAINNGICSHKGLLPFAGGFFVFADYLKPAVRLSSIMNLPLIYVFSHDSIAVGEDGPTHQPIEQLAMLRSQPNINVFRPADFNETIGAYVQALNQKTTPSAILVTRQDLPQLNNSDPNLVTKGAYLVYGSNGKNDLTIFATGSEVSLAISVAKNIEQKNKKIKVISVPCWELFLEQSEEYQSLILEKTSHRVSIELGTTFGWEKFTGDQGLNFGINNFGKSAPYSDVLKHFKFNSEEISEKIINKFFC